MFVSILQDLRSCWKELVLTDLAYKAIAFVMLTPLLGITFRLFVAASGRTVLADMDMLYFVLSPVGWIALVIVGGLWLGIIALEMAALMAIVCASKQGQRLGVRAALRMTLKRAWPILNLTARMTARGLLITAPFLAAAGLAFLLLLTEFDINYYLAEKPPAFWWAAVTIGAILLAGAMTVIRALIGWIFALPLLLFEDVAPSDAIRVSRQRARGRRPWYALWIVGWAVAMAVLSSSATAMIGLLGRALAPRATGSLELLALVIGTLLIIWGLMNVILTLLSATTFATLLVNLYRGADGQKIEHAWLPDAAPSHEAGTGFRVSNRWIAAGAVAALLIAAIVGVVTMRSVKLEDHTEIIAHRGASAIAPENTLAAVERAIRDGADWVEIDVQENADGQVVVVHDSDLKKLAGVNLKIWDATAADLERIDIGSSFAPEFSDERVPTLDRVLATCKGRIKVNIELKYYGHDQQLEQRVADLVASHDMESDIVIMSLNYDAIRKMKQLRPDWKVGLLTAVAIGNLTRLDADFLAVSTGLATRRFVRSAHARGKQVYVWTVNDPVTMSAMMGRGVDGIITDNPAVARSVIDQRAQMSTAERLLIEIAGLLGASPKKKLTIDDV